MTNDSFQPSLMSAEPFDQDAFVNSPHDDRAGVCPECRVGRCGGCLEPGCNCPHPFAAVGRAVVELDGSISRARQLLGQLKEPSEDTVGKVGARGERVAASRAEVGGRHAHSRTPRAKQTSN